MSRLSVVVTIVDGGATLDRCLTALNEQVGGPELEVIVPWDDSLQGMAELERRFPRFRFLALGRLDTLRPKPSPAGQHELFDRRRAAGLAIAGGELIAILEDRGVPRSDWAARVSELHAGLSHAVIGGAIQNGRDRPLNWAVYFCDFGRYQLPFEAGPRPYVSDVNICYKRHALEKTRELWASRYHETTVHWALQRAGEVLWLDPSFAVDQMRDGVTLGGVLSERIGWGRLFAYTRAKETSLLRRLILAGLCPVLPFVLLLRHLRMQFQKRVNAGRFVAVSPVVFLLLAAWSFGELIGYITRRP